MVVVRLQRLGTKKVPHHRVVVMERSRAQRSRVLENLGYYDPSKTPTRFEVNESRLMFWLSSGAQVSHTVERLVKRYKNVSLAATRSS